MNAIVAVRLTSAWKMVTGRKGAISAGYQRTRPFEGTRKVLAAMV